MDPTELGATPLADHRFRSGAPATPDTEAPALPEELGERLGGAAWELVWIKQGTEVWRVTTDTVAYLKIGHAGGRDGLDAERERLAWLGGRQSTPSVLAHHVRDATVWMLTAEVPGTPAHDPRFRMGSVQPSLEALGRGLRRFHDELPVDSCPFDAQLDVLLAAAEQRVASGGVDPATLGSSYRRHTPEDLLAHLLAMRPAEPDEDLVVAHGDPCLPNLLLAPAGDRVTGVVDVGRLGISDRYRDVAIIVRSLSLKTGPEVAYLLLDAYGIPQPDLLRLEFYVLLDEMW